MGSKFALVIANTDYKDEGLANLTAPFRDAEEFARVLSSPDICAFDHVKTLVNEPEYTVRYAIDDFFAEKKPDDLLVLYFSGHGIRDESGGLYLAVESTMRSRLRSTGIRSDFIRESMEWSRSQKQVLILDCCNSGAVTQGGRMASNSMGTPEAFGSGGGRIILTATDATQFSWEGDRLIGETQNSLFTHFLIEGLEGNADSNRDGLITVDELYDYAYEKVVRRTPNQVPQKWSSKQQGEIVLRANVKLDDVKPISLPQELTELLASSNTQSRNLGIQKLAQLLTGKNLGLARTAEDKLREIAANDNSLRLRKAASDVLAEQNVSPVAPFTKKLVGDSAVTRPLRVFLCHASQDKPSVRELHNFLKTEAWIDPWLDEEKLLPGQDWNSEIEKAVTSADMVIVCLSNKSVTKEGYVQREIRIALDVADEKPEETIFVVPIRFDDCTLPIRLKKWHYVDCFPESQRKQAYERLLHSFRLKAKSLKPIIP